MVVKNVSKVSVRKVQSKMYAVTLNLTVTEGTGENLVELINRNFTQNHKIGNTPAYTVNLFKIDMQACIDTYQEEVTIYNAAVLDTAITTLEGGLEWL